MIVELDEERRQDDGVVFELPLLLRFHYDGGSWLSLNGENIEHKYLRQKLESKNRRFKVNRS